MKTLAALPKTTGACVMIIGEERKVEKLLDDMKRDGQYRMQIVL